MDTRTNILMDRIPMLFPDKRFPCLKQKCRKAWAGNKQLELTTNFFTAFRPDFGMFTNNGCYIDKARDKVFSFAPFLTRNRIWIPEHTS